VSGPTCAFLVVLAGCAGPFLLLAAERWHDRVTAARMLDTAPPGAVTRKRRPDAGRKVPA
jgi:hypothetical protein